MKELALGVFAAFRIGELLLLLLYLVLSLILQSSNAMAQDGIRGPELPSRRVGVPGLAPKKPRPFQLTLATYPSTKCELLIASSGSGRSIQIMMDGSIRPRLYKGRYNLSLKCANFETYSLTFDVPKGIPSIPQPIHLRKQKVETVVTTVPGVVDIFLDRQPVGTSTSDGALRLPPLEPGTYELSARKEGFEGMVFTINVEQGMKPLRIELLRAESHVFDVLDKALSQNEIDEFFLIFSQLTPSQRESLRAKEMIWAMLSKLHKRSLEKLEKIGPDGLSISELELSEFRRLYSQAQALVTTDSVEVNRPFVMFATFWEAKEVSMALVRSPAHTELKAKLSDLVTQLEILQLSNASLLIELGQMYVVLQRYNNAEQSFLTASVLAPKWSIPHFWLGYLHMNQAYKIENNKKLYRLMLLRSAQEMKMAIERDPTLTRAYVLASFCYADAAQPTAAIETARAAVSSKPTSGLTKYALGYAYYSSGRKNFGLARQYLVEALSAVDERLDAAQVTRVKELLLVVSKK